MSIKLIDKPQHFTSEILFKLQKAKRRIVICALYIANDKFGNILLNLLCEIKELQPSLQLALYLDGLYSPEWIKEKYPQLSHVIHVVKLNRHLPTRVFHVKNWVIDDCLIASGVNINNRYFPMSDAFRLDRYFFIDNKVLCDGHIKTLTKIKNQAITQNWQAISAENLIFTDYEVMPFYTFSKIKQQQNPIHNLCYHAKQQIFFSTPYFNLTEAMLTLFDELTDKGIIIQIVVGINNQNKKGYNDRLKSNNLVTSFYFALFFDFLHRFADKLNKTIFIYQWQDANNSYHVKNLLIDDHITLLGSSNFNHRSECWDYENGLIIKAKSAKYQSMLLEEKKQVLAKSVLISSIEGLQLSMPKSHQKLIKVLKQMKLYNQTIRLL